MRVKAVADGFYGGKIVKVGTMFDLDTPQHFSDAHRKGEVLGWMEIVSATPAEIKQCVEFKRLPESALAAARPAKAPKDGEKPAKTAKPSKPGEKPEAGAEAGAGGRPSDESPL